MNYALHAALVVVPVSVAVIAVIAFFGQRRLAKHRGVSRKEFIAAFTDSGAPVEIPATVYDYYKGQFSPRNTRSHRMTITSPRFQRVTKTLMMMRHS